jgi:hypothetical protein
MNSIIGSQFEASLRILLLFEAAQNEPLTEGAIVALDYIAVYSHDFGLPQPNLNGESKYRFGEFASRRSTVRAAIKQLVLDGLVAATRSPDGFVYKLSEEGADFAANLSSDYADAYCEAATLVISGIGVAEETLSEMINRKSVASVREG